MSKRIEKLNKIETRQSLGKLANELIEQFEKEKSVLVNYYGILGMGKDLFLTKALIPLLDARGIFRSEIIYIPETPTSTEVLNVSKQIAELMYSKIIKSKEKIANDMDGLESDYLKLRGKLIEKTSKQSFAILINDISNFPFDDLDWFQSTVLDTLASSASSIVIVTSQTELNWHSWEMRNKCKSIKLPVFTDEEILELCKSHSLAQKVKELSAGHPKTVQGLVDVVGKNKALSSITEEDVSALNKELFEKLEEEINENLNFKGKNEWLTEVFYLASAADGFDADLISDVISAFNITIPEDITDIAWEMAYTGLAAWDFDEKTYKIVPELRDRIVKYMEHERKTEFSKALETIAKSYLLRAEILHDWDIQLIRFINYFYSARKLENRENESLEEIKKNIDLFLKTGDDNQKLFTTISQQQKDHNWPNMESIYVALLSFLERGWFPPTIPLSDALLFDGIGDVSMPTTLEVPYSNHSESLGRKETKEVFSQLIDGQLGNTRILFVQGDPGIGKSYLLRDLQDIAEKGKLKLVAFVDLNYPYNRRRLVILETVVQQLGIHNDSTVTKMIGFLKDSVEKSRTYIGIAQIDPFEDAYNNAVQAIRVSLKNLKLENFHPVIFIDTFDDNPAINQLSSWLFSRFIPAVEEDAYFVIAGRRIFESIKGINMASIMRTRVIKLLEFTDDEIRDLIQKRDLKGLELDNELIHKIVKLSARNPLIVDWILFYLNKFGRDEDWNKLIATNNKDEALRKIATFMWKNPSTTGGIPALKAFHAAIHFGSHFNIDLYKAVATDGHSEETTYEKAFRDLAQYFYARGGPENWTLHDQIRDWMREASKERHVVNEFIIFSRKAIEKYYNPKIQALQGKSLTLEEEIYLDDLEAQRFFHRLYVEVVPGYNSSDLHLDLWDLLDSLWHRYRLEQMAQLIQFGREVQEWKPGAEKDTLLPSILDAAQAWAYFSQADYKNAEKFANKILERVQVPRRLYATAQVIIGLLPAQDPDRAIKNLEPAKLAYQQILSQMVNGRLPNSEFTDNEVDIYPEIHQVLMAIGRIHLIHSFDLEKAEKSFQEAYETARKETWREPLYAAVALNEWARVLRFGGEFSDALNKTMSAIAVYKKASGILANDFYLGYFDETLGLIYKELGEYKIAHDYLDNALSTYTSLEGLDETYQATILLEKGSVYLLEGKFEIAGEFLLKAHNIFSKSMEESPWYYHNSLNKIGEYYIKVNELEKAKAVFKEQKERSARYGHELWEYWATQYLAEIDYQQKGVYDKETLEDLLIKFDQLRGRKFGPAFWHTKYSLYVIAKNDEKNMSAALTHLTEGLAYLAGHWRAQFWHNLTLLRTELLNLDVDNLVSETERLIKLWKNMFRNEDPAPAFIQMCETVKDSVERLEN